MRCKQRIPVVKILIIDDHPLIRKGLILVLNQENNSSFNVDEADGELDALKLMSENSYDLVLLDVSLNGRSGLDILAWIKKEYQAVPVLIISMHPEDQYALRAMRLGAAGYLSKHSAAVDLIQAIHQIGMCGKYISPTLSLLLAEEVARRTDSSGPLHKILSNREMEIGRLISSGLTPREIATTLNLSVKTINTYRFRLLHKLAVRNNVDLTTYYIENKLLC